MRSTILHLLTGIFILVAFIQCKDSISPTGTSTDSENLKKPPLNRNLKKPTLIIPGNNSEQPTSTSFEWEEVEGAESYQIQLSEDKKFSSTIVDSVSSSTKFEIQGLPYGSTIHWHVRPIAGQQQGPWSVSWKFTTMQKPDNSEPISTDLKSPGDGASDQSANVELQWTAVASATAYKVQVATDQNFNSIVAEKEVEGTSFQTSELDNEETYYWRVEPIVADEETEWSEVFNFITQKESEETPSVTLVSPSDDASDLSTSPTLEWEELSDIDEYQVQLATSSSFTSPVIDENTSQQYLEVSGLDNSQSYYWRVQAKNDGDPLNWSSVRNFDTKSATNDGGDKGSDYDGPNSVEGDRQALMDLYQATNGSNWNNSSGWGNGNPSNSWHGVEVDAEGRVVRLDLYSNGLSGNLPESIGNLSKVRYLNLKNNNMSGEIPSSIGNMASLERLILAGRNYEIGSTLKEPPVDKTWHYHQGKRYSNTNNFSGRIPSSIGNLSRLIDLEIANQPNITGPIPAEIGKLSNLEGLYLSFNDFSGTTLPSSLGNLTNLRHLYIASAQLEGEIPSSIEKLTKLTFVDMGESSNHTPDNHLTGKIPDFSKMKGLRSIVLTDNNLTGEYPNYWNNGDFHNLNTLRFAWNNLTGTLHGFDNLPNLKNFGVEGNNLTGSIYNQLLAVPRGIMILGLGWNNFTGEIPQKNWPDFSQLRVLRLNDNQLVGNIPSDLINKVNNENLRWVYLQNNNFTSVDLNPLINLKSKGLKVLNISGNPIPYHDYVEPIVESLSHINLIYN